VNREAFHHARAVIADAVARRVFPCAVAEVGHASGALWRHAAGRLTYDSGASVASEDTIFDLASLTKVIATATLALIQYQRQQLGLEEPLHRHLAGWKGREREAVTVRDLLEHCSGLPAHQPYYQMLAGRPAFESAICAEPLAYSPRTQSLYSDPGFILLGFALENSGGNSMDAQFQDWRGAVSIEGPLTFNPPREWDARIAPTEVDSWRGRLLIGEVHDENAAALGGVAAHAGLFGTAASSGACARWWLSRLLGRNDAATGVKGADAVLFAQRSTVPASSRALAWDTMLPTSSCGTRMSPRAIGHTGFTGTSLWIDPERDLYFVLLSNRLHPTRDNDLIQPVRRAFHDAVAQDLQEQS